MSTHDQFHFVPINHSQIVQLYTMPIHFAASSGHKEVVSLLLEKGAQIDAEDKVCPWTMITFIVCRSLTICSVEMDTLAFCSMYETRGSCFLAVEKGCTRCALIFFFVICIANLFLIENVSRGRNHK